MIDESKRDLFLVDRLLARLEAEMKDVELAGRI